jgi:hypothetical protein
LRITLTGKIIGFLTKTMDTDVVEGGSVVVVGGGVVVVVVVVVV